MKSKLSLDLASRRSSWIAKSKVLGELNKVGKFDLSRSRYPLGVSSFVDSTVVDGITYEVVIYVSPYIYGYEIEVDRQVVYRSDIPSDFSLNEIVEDIMRGIVRVRFCNSIEDNKVSKINPGGTFLWVKKMLKKLKGNG
jgi:hypothetical protein